jgi:MFS family permease
MSDRRNEKQTADCAVIRDLLPLYQDQVCSEGSRRLVEEHLKSCAACRKIAESLSDTELDRELKQNTSEVLSRQARKEKRRAARAGGIMAGILLIPIIICLICNLAVGHGLNWFFIVLTAMLIVASVTVVPLLTEKARLGKALISLMGSLILLYLSTSVYVGGNWFFTASAGTVFGLSAVAVPLILKSFLNSYGTDETAGSLTDTIPCGGSRVVQWMRGKTGVLSMLWESLWIYLLMLAAGWMQNPAERAEFLRPALSAVTVFLIIAWAVFLICRYLSLNRWFKAATGTWIGGFCFCFMNDIFYLLLDGRWRHSLRFVDFSHPVTEQTINANIYLTGLLIGLAAGGVFLILGFIRRHRREQLTER